MDKKHWHPGFYGAAEWELKENRDHLEFKPEYQLGKEAPQTDLLIIKKIPAVTIDNEIGKIFKTHNIVEYKGSGDKLTIDNYYKTIGYAALYKGLGRHVNEIPAEEITVTLIREAFPRELFKMLKGYGVSAEKKFEGIYYLSGKIIFDTQMIVTKELDGYKHPSLKILSKNATESDVRRFLEEARLAKDPGDLQNIDAVLQVSVSANRKLFDEVRKDEDMCQALRELMKEEIAEERAEEKLVDIKELMKNMKWTAEQAMSALGISASDQAKYSALL